MQNEIIRQVQEKDIDQCFQIEQTAYEGDEAASRESIRTRVKEYPEGFIVLEKDNVIAGFINCGATNDVDLANEEFKGLVGHEPKGKHVVIFSVVVHPDFQGKGFAGKLLTTFKSHMAELGKSTIHLICRAHHIDFYKKYGFHYIGESGSEHGGLKWHEMSLQL